MRAVGVRELKNRLSEYLRLVRNGEEVLVTDRGRVIAELRRPGAERATTPFPRLLDYAHRGKARLGAENRADAYPELEPLLSEGQIDGLLDEERGER